MVADLRRPLDYPAEAVCGLCGEPIRREQCEPATPGAGWQLKYPGKAAAIREVPDGDGEPGQHPGLRLVPSAGPAVHIPEPEPGSVRAADGRRTELRNARFPVRAVCRTCRQGIRADGFFLPFVHDGGETADGESDELAEAPGPAPDGQWRISLAAASREQDSSRARTT